MEKQELIKKLEKFDLTEEQLNAIESIIALELYQEFEDCKIIIDEIITSLEKITAPVLDISDVGNEIGIAVGKFIKTDNDKKEFIRGIEHGISLIDGTH
ncbi:MAG: hypothetical protein L3J56_14235 [Bacteroidales bacterium]|nr:hypothetical protein [Bacteroidales bacterium]